MQKSYLWLYLFDFDNSSKIIEVLKKSLLGAHIIEQLTGFSINEG